jgi:hypothetical protein
MAVFAVLVALGATAVALYSLDQAREAKSKTADTAASRPGVSTSTAGAPAEAPAATPASTPTTPRAQFVPDANRAELKIPPPDGCASIFVDIDTMMVGTFNGHEFYLSSCLGPTAFRIDKTAGAVPTTGNPTPEVCAAQVSGANTGSELVLQARAGLTFCLLTNKDDATRQSIPQRIAIVEVRDVGLDKSVTVVVSTYRVPNQVA